MVRPVAPRAFVTLIVISLMRTSVPLQLMPNGFNSPASSSGPTRLERAGERGLVARVVEETLRTLGHRGAQSWSERVVVRVRLVQRLGDMDLAKAEVRDRRARLAEPAAHLRVGIWSESSDTLPITFFGIFRGRPAARLPMQKVASPPSRRAGIGKVEVWHARRQHPHPPRRGQVAAA
jgi:hypothetical protein